MNEVSDAPSGARRPAGTPYVDPRLEALADAYNLLLSAGTERGGLAMAGGRP